MRLLLAALEHSSGIGSTSCSTTCLDERRDEVVVDDHRAVDLALDVELGEAMGERLRVGVCRPVGEARPRLVDGVAAEAERRAPLLRPATSQRTSTPSARSSRSSRSARRRICALKAPARPRSPVSGRIATVCTLAPLEQRQTVTDDAARAVPVISSSIRSANGRIASIRVCARRSRARRDELHRLRDLARIRDGADAPLEVLDRSPYVRRLRRRRPRTRSCPANFSTRGRELLASSSERSPWSRISA